MRMPTHQNWLWYLSQRQVEYGWIAIRENRLGWIPGRSMHEPDRRRFGNFDHPLFRQ
jgi:hypothetical protein